MNHYTLEYLSDLFKPNEPGNLKFAINSSGAHLRESDFEIVHEKIMHTIVVKKDLTEFQHVHPEINSDGVFALEGFVFPRAGHYRLFADFSPKSIGHAGHHHSSMVLYHDITVGEPDEEERPNIQLISRDQAQGYDVTLSLAREGHMPTLSFTIRRDGQLITDLENYLGALGHLVVLSQNNLEYLHAHPDNSAGPKQNGTIDFMVHFTASGLHKAFLQFQHEHKVVTSSFGLYL
jgi:hypothetical protein